MALTGNLQDISLPNLVQMLCLDQRQAMLSLKHRGIEEGLIYFADGQIVHALVGPLVGPEAIYKLLSWAEGSFKVNWQQKKSFLRCKSNLTTGIAISERPPPPRSRQ